MMCFLLFLAQLARLNCISDLLSRVKYTELQQEHLSLPPRDSDVPEEQRNYKHPPLAEWNIVPQIYTSNDLLLHDTAATAGYDTHEVRGGGESAAGALLPGWLARRRARVRASCV